MKCPKCSYLGFETGDRCKNCGYDFSLATPAPPADLDLPIRTEAAPETAAPELWLDRLDRSMDEVSLPAAKQAHLVGVPEHPPPPLEAAPEGSLPLFNPDDPDDIPLIALPATPRAPLSVRRTPETPRLRAVPRVARRPSSPALDFHEESAGQQAEDFAPEPPARPPSPTRPAARPVAGVREVGGRRALAAAIDHALLLAVDAAVVYFTLRMAGLGTADVRLLPLPPIVVFLAVLKLSYFTAFTAIGGQTIGKMAAGIRVIGEHGALDGATAVRRTLAGLLSVLTLGIGFLPAFFGADRRTLHDRLTGTRVVGLPSV